MKYSCNGKEMLYTNLFGGWCIHGGTHGFLLALLLVVILSIIWGILGSTDDISRLGHIQGKGL